MADRHQDGDEVYVRGKELLFNSWPFVALVLLTMLIYYGLAKTENQQILVLITSSLIFYSYGQPTLLLLLVASIVINAGTCYQIENVHGRRLRIVWAVAGVGVNLAILAIFKYGGLLAEVFTSAGSQSGGVGAFLIQLPLPIGISFYTFQGISLVVDTFSGDFKQRNRDVGFKRSFRDTFFFISFFPQLVAGPVLKAKQFIPQIERKYWSKVDGSLVFHCLVTGYFLKMVIADNLKDQTFWIQFPYFQYRSSFDLIAMLVGYSAQIFADFAGYSLIAIGVAALFGYRLPENFNFPYVSRSIAEFWRRWHISLSSWLKEYLYFPLGGSKKGQYRTYFNLIVVMLLGGLWHGAAWSFAIWGLWHGTGLALERMAASAWGQATGGHRPALLQSAFARHCISLLQWLAVFAFVSFGWLLFELTDFNEALVYLSSIKDNIGKAPSLFLLIVLMILVTPVFIYHVLYLISAHTRFQIGRFVGVLYGTMLYLIVFNAGTSESFIYFQF